MTGEIVEKKIDTDEEREDETDPTAIRIDEFNVNEKKDLEGYENYTETLHIESEWTVEESTGFMKAPVSFCSATVCNGTLKPWDEIKKTWQMWEGRPVTFEHPDEMVVKNPSDVIGFLSNVKVDGEKQRLKGELYVMLEPAEFNRQSESHWNVIVEAVKDRDEISIGYWAVPEKEEGEYADEFGNELEYEEKVAQILPDHIASVDKGACSPDQGCGVGVESRGENCTEIDEDAKKGDMMEEESEAENEDEDENEGEEEDVKMNLLKKIHAKLKTIVREGGDGERESEELELKRREEKKEKEDDSMNEDEDKDEKEDKDEDESRAEDECEENGEDVDGDVDVDKDVEPGDEVSEKEKTIEDLREKVSTLKSELDEYREKEIQGLRERAEELTEMDGEELANRERHELEALIEGAESAARRSSVNEGREDGREKSEAGKNLRSPPGSSDVGEGPEVIDLYEDPLSED